MKPGTLSTAFLVVAWVIIGLVVEFVLFLGASYFGRQSATPNHTPAQQRELGMLSLICIVLFFTLPVAAYVALFILHRWRRSRDSVDVVPGKEPADAKDDATGGG